MHYTRLILALLLAVSLSGCILSGRPLRTAKTPTVARAISPPPPVVAAPPPPSEPLSIPQTNIQLPEPQPVSAEALATTLPTEEPPAPPAPAPAKPAPKRLAPPSAPATAAPPPTAAPEPEREPLKELVPPNELTKLREDTAAAIREARRLMAQAEGKPLNRTQRSQINSVASLIRQAADLEGQGNYRQASELANKAVALAQGLK